MNIKDPRHDIPIWNSGCAALMCIVFAAVSVEGCAIQMKAKPCLHLACALLFLALAAALYRGIRPYRADAAHMIGAPGRGRRARHAAIASALLMVGLGYAGAAWLRNSWALGAALFACLLWLAPWSRIPLCRNRLPLACVLLLLGAAAPLLAGQPARPPLFLLASAWILWLAATGAWLRLLLLKHRKSRALAAYPGSG